MDNNNVFVKIDELSKIYYPTQSLFSKKGSEVVALDRISLEIKRGEIFGLVGESGSGKTTCGRVLVKLENPTSGKVQVGGRHVETLTGRELKSYRRRVQMIFQDPYQSLNPQLTVLQTVAEPLVVQGIGTWREREDHVLADLEEVGLSPAKDFLFRYPHLLSGGQRQRVSIARAMILDPEFVVADEPVSMLDASIQAQLLNMLLDLREAHHLTMLFITHDLAVARYLCDRLAVIYNGRILERGPAENVINDPHHPYTKALLKAAAVPIRKREQPLPQPKDVGEENRFGDNRSCVFLHRCPLRKGECEDTEATQEIRVGNEHFTTCLRCH
jgi:peptide/nickel transport system ATP-binding protein